jgi:hypothetical protein
MILKLPAFQFYPGDWMKDPALRAVSSGARGLWMDMLCLMHESVQRGYLQHGNGQPVTTEQIARMTGNLSLVEVEGWIAELENCGVSSRSNAGVIYSRRMLRDERKRKACQEAGKRGGNPALLQVNDLAPTLKGGVKGGDNRQVKHDAKGEITPSSSFSPSSSPSGLSKPSNEGLDTLPAKPRKASKPQALKDPRAQHWAIQTIHSLTGYWPKKILWDEIISALGDVPQPEKLTDCFKVWVKAGHYSGNTSWYLDWFVNGIPATKGSPRNYAPRQSVAEQNAANSAIALQRTLERMSDD